MKEIGTVIESSNYSIHNSICELLKKFKFKTLCHQSGIQKENGFSTVEILTLLIMLPLMMLKNVHQLYQSAYSDKATMEKDAFYRLKNNEHYSWRRLLYAVAKKFKNLTNQEKPEEIQAKGKPSAFIIDDTTDQRVGYKMENISYVFDHVIHKAVLGFKLLTLAYFDGKSLTPLDFSLHTEKKLKPKKLKKQYKKQVNPKSCGAKRRKETKDTKIKASLDMIKRAVKNGFIADYVLCDAWFTSEELIKTIRGIKNGAMHIIAGIKNGNQKYGYQGDLFNAKEIIAQLKKTGSQRRCRKWNTRYLEATVTYKGVGTLKLFMSRFPRQKEWRVFVSTNTSLSYVEMMEIYGIRWTIEVFFRECKQYLQLGKCQSQDFDAQIASITVVFILYTLLAYLKRMDSYETLGELFRLTQQDVCEKNMAERLFSLFEEILAVVIDSIASNGSMDITQFRQSEEYAFIKDIFASSFLLQQIHSVDKAV